MFRVVPYGHKSEETEMVPGVPQGTILTTFLFVIMWLEALQMTQGSI